MDTVVYFMSAMNKPESQWTQRERRAIETVRQISESATPEQRRAHAISWAYGNLAIEDPDVTKEDIERAYDSMEHSR